MRLLPIAVLLASCNGPGREPREPSPLLDVAETESWKLPGLKAPAMVIRTEGDVPHVYAGNREDLARVQGFVLARHRFFMMDLARRLGLGEVSSLLGQDALATDQESRGNGMTHVANTICDTLNEEHALILDAYAEGVNAYIEQVRLGLLPPPSEYEVAGPFLGAQDPIDLMKPFDRRSVCGVGATLVYELGYETGDVGREVSWQALEGLFEGDALGDLRQAGVYDDIWFRQEPVFPVASAHGWGLEQGDDLPARPRSRGGVGRLPDSLVSRLTSRLSRFEDRLMHDHEDGWGSNAWAVMGTHSADGRALLAGDGHLPLSVPSLFYQAGLDTRELGGGDTHQMGLLIPGMPFLAVGTNGRVAWSQTQLMGDITDWYREEIRLNDAGEPVESYFQGEWKGLVRIEESVEVADVPLLGSEGRTETWARWTTFDGRWIADVEGRSAGPDEELADGEALINLQGDWVVPGDVDGDGVIVAVSFDYTGLDRGNAITAVDAFGHANDVHEFREATKRLVAYSQNITVADANGSVLYTPWQPVPCREYLERDGTGMWTEGSNPSRMLDGTKYGGFEIPFVDGVVDESQAADPYKCVVPFDSYPQAIDPARGYVLTANNDPVGASLDGSLHDDPWYIGGPWIEGYRADTIDQGLATIASTASADVASMAALQGDTRSRTGEQFVPVLSDAIDRARTAAAGTTDPDTAEGRLAALYLADAAALDEVQARLLAWEQAGYATPAGVDTFYHAVADGEAEDSVATAIFNAWFGRFVGGVLDDEGFPGVYHPTGGTGRMRTLLLILDGRGADNPLGLASWNPDTEESAFFDVLGTDPVETSDEIAVQALLDALAFLRSAPTKAGSGGYGTDDMDEWRWGLRHWVHFDSLLADFLGDDDSFSFLIDQFSITTDQLPLADSIGTDDPRRGMTGFPRPGDNFSVDAANSGMNGTSFTYGSGPVFRMVIAVGPDRTDGVNILPGGQSGLKDSPYFADQAALWLGNETVPLRFEIEDVVAGAVGRETYLPDDPLP